MVALNEKGPASAATDPDHGSNSSQQENAVNKQHDTTTTAFVATPDFHSACDALDDTLPRVVRRVNVLGELLEMTLSTPVSSDGTAVPQNMQEAVAKSFKGLLRSVLAVEVQWNMIASERARTAQPLGLIAQVERLIRDMSDNELYVLRTLHPRLAARPEPEAASMASESANSGASFQYLIELEKALGDCRVQSNALFVMTDYFFGGQEVAHTGDDTFAISTTDATMLAEQADVLRAAVRNADKELRSVFQAITDEKGVR